MSTRFQYNKGPLFDGGAPRDSALSAFEFGPYLAEATQRYVYGTRYLMWDGRVFKYALSQGELESYHGCRATEDAALGILAAPTAAAIGDRMVQITLASRVEDDLVGGYIALYDGGDIDTTCQRGIIGSTKSDTTVDVYLDYPLHQPIVASTDSTEVFENPYKAISETTDSYSAWVGVPGVSCAAALKTWIQTWGPCLVSGGETIDTPSADARTLVWGSNAALFKTATKTSGQIAGYILNQGSTSVAGPIIMLMCST